MMTNSLADILGNKNFDEPAEVRLIKDYVQRHFQREVGVLVKQDQIVIGVPSSALAGALRMHLHTLKQECQTDKRLVIRIGG